MRDMLVSNTVFASMLDWYTRCNHVIKYMILRQQAYPAIGPNSGSNQFMWQTGSHSNHISAVTTL